MASDDPTSDFGVITLPKDPDHMTFFVIVIFDIFAIKLGQAFQMIFLITKCRGLTKKRGSSGHKENRFQ